MTWSSQRRVTGTVVSLRIIGFQAQVNLESVEVYHFPMSFFPMKWWKTCYKMVTDKLQNGVQQCFSNFIAGYLYLSFCESTLCFMCIFHSQTFPRVYPHLVARNILPCLLLAH